MSGKSVAGTLLSLLVLGSVGCSGLRRPPPVVDRSQDARILVDVRERLAAEPALTGDEMRVEVDGGVVVLYGSVRGIAAWECAIRNAQLVPGVRSVTDFLVIDPGPREVGCTARRGEDLSMARILPPP